jgi:hypothetical protein
MFLEQRVNNARRRAAAVSGARHFRAWWGCKGGFAAMACAAFEDNL